MSKLTVKRRCPSCRWKLRIFVPLRGNMYYFCRNPRCRWQDPHRKETMHKIPPDFPPTTAAGRPRPTEPRA